MGRSWLGLQLLLSCALLLAVVAVEGRCCEEEESSSEEECLCEKRHHCVEEGSKKRCHHKEEECCCKKRHHHKDKGCCKMKHSFVEEEEADKNKGPRVGKKHSKRRHPFFDDLEEASSESSEILELMAKEEQQRIMEKAAQSDAVPQYKKEQAVAYFNRGSMGAYYKHLEDGQLELQEAIGVMVYVKMLLAKTNCTRPKEQDEAGLEYSRAYMEKEGCQLLPKLKQEKYNCTFGIFINMRTEKKAVVSKDCTAVSRIKFPFLKGLTF
ncbi:uncharacterized protein LOC113447453 [Pseudonaja textilis]|uniref:uncharacterized protein LOC113447453 n=1 Tax=Pseudonaja textilis TaxID=8673 RepID=UPI000EA83AC3|nr:uncharacterized protein LOC113447453 [Pseudonaja textilis]